MEQNDNNLKYLFDHCSYAIKEQRYDTFWSMNDQSIIEK